jgi:hypothetical protein
VWAPHESSAFTPAEQVVLEVGATASRVAALAHMFKGDGNREIRDRLILMVDQLDQLGESVQAGQVSPAGEDRPRWRAVGERTRDGIQRMLGNRGRQ